MGNLTNVLHGDTTYLYATYDNLGNKTSQTDGNGNTTTWEYDERRNVVSRSLADEHVEQFRYSCEGYLVEHTDFSQNHQYLDYDKYGRVLKKNIEPVMI